jgi:hypothetical protein
MGLVLDWGLGGDWRNVRGREKRQREKREERTTNSTKVVVVLGFLFFVRMEASGGV